MICPKCGFEQPDGVECMRCGVIISRYKGPVAGAAAPRSTPPPFAPGASPPPPPFIPPPPVIAGGAVHAPIPPPPSISPAGTVFGGSPASPAGGSVYGGPGSVAPAFSSFGPGFHGSFEVVNVLSETFSTYFSNFLPFVLLTVLVFFPVILLASYVSTIKNNPLLAASIFLGTLVLQLILAQVVTAGITYGVYQQMRGKSPSLLDCLKVGLSRLVPVLVVAFLSGIIVFVGLLFCVVPGFIVATMLAVVIPVTVEERLGLFSAMQRSSNLTTGFRWQVFGVLLVLGLLQQIPAQILTRTVHDLGSLLMFTILAAVPTTGLQATASAVMYYRLRSVKEGIDVDQISSVFA